MKWKFFAILVLAFICICAVSAANDDYFVKNTTVTIHGFNFTVPDGFSPLDGANINETDNGITTVSKFYIDKKGGVVMLSVISGENISNNLDDYKSVGDNPRKMTINGQEGLHVEKNSFPFFIYLKNESAIILQAPDDSYFKGMMDK